MLDTLSKILFVVSTSAFVPVILALLGLAVWTLLLLGGFLSELVARVAVRRPLPDRMGSLCESDPEAAARQIEDCIQSLPSTGFLRCYLRARRASKATGLVADKIVDDIELQMSRSVASLSSIARLGPMLGLAGTLIPLGPGLVSLARGDVAGLAGQLVIAFSTTIVGLLVGMVAFACAQVRRGWYARDLADILFLEEARSGNGGANP